MFALGYWLQGPQTPVTGFILHHQMHGKNEGGRPRTIYVKQVELELTNRRIESHKFGKEAYAVCTRLVLGLYSVCTRLVLGLYPVCTRFVLGLYSVCMALIISVEIKWVNLELCRTNGWNCRTEMLHKNFTFVETFLLINTCNSKKKLSVPGSVFCILLVDVKASGNPNIKFEIHIIFISSTYAWY